MSSLFRHHSWRVRVQRARAPCARLCCGALRDVSHGPTHAVMSLLEGGVGGGESFFLCSAGR